MMISSRPCEFITYHSHLHLLCNSAMNDQKANKPSDELRVEAAIAKRRKSNREAAARLRKRRGEERNVLAMLVRQTIRERDDIRNENDDLRGRYEIALAHATNLENQYVMATVLLKDAVAFLRHHGISTYFTHPVSVTAPGAKWPHRSDTTFFLNISLTQNIQNQ